MPWPMRRAPYHSVIALAIGAQQLAAGEVDRHQLHRLQPGIAIARRAGREPRGVVVFAAERLGDANTRQALLQLGVDRRYRIARPKVRAARAALEPDGDQHLEGQHDERGERQANVEHQQDPDHTHAADDTGEGEQQALLQQLGERLDVGGHAGHDPPAHLPVVVVERQPLEMPERSRPQRVHDALGSVRRVHELDDLVAPTQQLHRQKRDAHRHEHAAAVTFHTTVETVTDQQRANQGGGGIDQHRARRRRSRGSGSVLPGAAVSTTRRAFRHRRGRPRDHLATEARRQLGR